VVQGGGNARRNIVFLKPLLSPVGQRSCPSDADFIKRIFGS
jgi:hypothetical protein